MHIPSYVNLAAPVVFMWYLIFVTSFYLDKICYYMKSTQTW